MRARRPRAQLERREGKLIDEAGVRGQVRRDPGSIPDYLALVGDSADGFPGLPGWGAKSAAAVLARYEHFEAIPADARTGTSRCGCGRAGPRCATAREAAMLFRDLATLRTHW